MKRRKRGHILRLDGPGKTRERLAEMIREEFNCECDPNEIWMNRHPAAKWLDLARWGVTCRFPDGLTRNVHSWDTMTNIVRFGLAVVDIDTHGVEVCFKEKKGTDILDASRHPVYNPVV